MVSINHLTHRIRAVQRLLGLVLCGSFLTMACQKSSVTEVAQANPNQPTNTPTLPSPQASAPNAIAAPVAADGRQVAIGVAPDYKQDQTTPAPIPGVSVSPGASPTIRHLDNGKMIIVQGKNLPPEMMGPPPTPTPTPAPTPAVEMVNGKIKQRWQAPPEAVSVKNPLKVTAEVTKKGQYLYKNRCEICHGSEGKGNGPYNDPKWTQATNLASKAVQANTDGELFYKISTSRDRHPASKVLYSEEERWMVVAFLRTLK